MKGREGVRKKQGLGARLAAVAAFVHTGARLADIGTDHAGLPLELLAAGKISCAVAADVHAGPFEAANRAVQSRKAKNIEVRRGDGLAVLAPGEVDAVAVAGMGGSLICRILAEGAAVLTEVKSLVLQPQNDAAELRAWLYDHGWHIADEALALEDGRLYEILLAEPGEEKKPDALLLEIGPVLWRKKPPLLRRHIERLLSRERRIANGMGKSESAKKSAGYEAVKKKIVALEEKLIW